MGYHAPGCEYRFQLFCITDVQDWLGKIPDKIKNVRYGVDA
jgi:hypothetical protein